MSKPSTAVVLPRDLSVPSVEARLISMQQGAAMLARFCGGSALDPNNAGPGSSSAAFYGFEGVAESLYTDIRAVSAALHAVHGVDSPVLLSAPDAIDDEWGA